MDENGDEVDLTYSLARRRTRRGDGTLAAHASRKSIVASGVVKRKPRHFGGASVQMLPVDLVEPLQRREGDGADDGATPVSSADERFSDGLSKVLIVEPAYRLSAGVTLKKLRDTLSKSMSLLPARPVFLREQPQCEQRRR